MDKEENCQSEKNSNREDLKRQSSIKEVLCIQGCRAISICVQQNCEEPAIICGQERCVCEKSHLNCNIKKLKGIIQTLETKAHLLPSLINENQNLIDEMISEHQTKIFQHKDMIKFLQKQKKQIKEIIEPDPQSNLAILGNSQNLLYTKIKNKKTDQIKGCDIHKIQNQLIDSPYEQLSVQIQIVKQIWRKHKQKAEKFQVELFQELKQFFKTKFVFKMFSEKSNILSNIKEVNFLKSYFQDTPIQRLQLLYRASQHDFSVDKFKTDCVNISHTLTFIHTTQGYKIGFYTPQEWKNYESRITNQETMCIAFSSESMYGNYDIVNRKQFGPCFIDNDNENFSINLPDKSNINQCKNNQAICNDQTLYEQNLTTKQWEVWQIVFKKQDQKK